VASKVVLSSIDIVSHRQSTRSGTPVRRLRRQLPVVSRHRYLNNVRTIITVLNSISLFSRPACGWFSSGGSRYTYVTSLPPLSTQRIATVICPLWQISCQFLVWVPRHKGSACNAMVALPPPPPPQQHQPVYWVFPGASPRNTNSNIPSRNETSSILQIIFLVTDWTVTVL
jgi:hypothetical protein